MFCGASGVQSSLCVSYLPNLRKSLWRLYTSSRINTRRCQYTSALFNIWNVVLHPTTSTWNVRTFVNQLWDFRNTHSNCSLLSKSLDAWLRYPGKILAFRTLWKIGKNSAGWDCSRGSGWRSHLFAVYQFWRPERAAQCFLDGHNGPLWGLFNQKFGNNDVLRNFGKIHD